MADCRESASGDVARAIDGIYEVPGSRLKELHAAEVERDDLRAENQRLRDLYENAIGNRERFGWTINHLLECEDALRTIEATATRATEALHRIADGDVPGVAFAEDDLISAFARKAIEDE